MRNSTFAFLVLFLLISFGSFNPMAKACSPQSEPEGSGIEGQVFIGPISPVARIGEPQERPYQANITVLNRTGQIVTQVQTDAEGHFQVTLEPGTYILRPESPRLLPHSKEQTIIVTSKQLTPVRINYDSGLR